MRAHEQRVTPDVIAVIIFAASMWWQACFGSQVEDINPYCDVPIVSTGATSALVKSDIAEDVNKQLNALLAPLGDVRTVRATRDGLGLIVRLTDHAGDYTAKYVYWPSWLVPGEHWTFTIPSDIAMLDTAHKEWFAAQHPDGSMSAIHVFKDGVSVTPLANDIQAFEVNEAGTWMGLRVGRESASWGEAGVDGVKVIGEIGLGGHTDGESQVVAVGKYFVVCSMTQATDRRGNTRRKGMWQSVDAARNIRTTWPENIGYVENSTGTAGFVVYDRRAEHYCVARLDEFGNPVVGARLRGVQRSDIVLAVSPSQDQAWCRRYGIADVLPGSVGKIIVTELASEDGVAPVLKKDGAEERFSGWLLHSRR